MKPLWLKDPYTPPLHILITNTKQSLLRRFRKIRQTLDQEEIIATAESSANAGPLQETLPKGFEVLINSYNNSHNISHVGHQIMVNALVTGVKNRILINQYLADNPAVKNEVIVKPIFIVGFARSGTTLLHNLLGQYSNARVPMYWELKNLVPPPSTAEQRYTDPRIQSINDELIRLYRTFPKLPSIHRFHPNAPEECIPLLENSFACVSYSLFADFPEYCDWLFNYDMLQPYEYHRQQLQIMQAAIPGSPWILKSPVHMYHLEALLKIFPDACIIQTHREIEEVLSSRCSLHATLKRVTNDNTNYKDIGLVQLTAMQIQLEKLQAARKKHKDSFFDVQYSQLIKNPKQTVNRILEHFGYPLSDQHNQKMDAWIQDNPQHKHGKHKHALEWFGLEANKVRETFAAYRSAYLS